MTWHQLQGDYWRSSDGRFDLCPHFRGGWSVVDGWQGARAIFAERADAEAWAASRQ